MTVFKTCMLIMRRRIGALAVYFAVFLALCVVMPMMFDEQYTTDFSEMKPNFTIVNRDVTGRDGAGYSGANYSGAAFYDGLAAFLREHGSEVVLEDRLDVLQDATFYGATDCIIIVPEGFYDAFVEGLAGVQNSGAAEGGGEALELETVTTTESARGFYVDMLVGRYLNQARIYYGMGGVSWGTSGEQSLAGAEPSANAEQELIAMILSDLSRQAVVETKHFGTGAPIDPVYRFFNMTLCYILIVLVILCVSNITSSFRRPDIRMRNLCTPLKNRSLSFQQILCGVLVSLIAWVLMTLLGFVMYGSVIVDADRRIVALILLNTFVVMLLALSIASFVSSFIRSPNSQNAMANFVSLGLCFLGGVFVPLELFGEGLLAVVRFTPVYWYGTALNTICDLNSFESSALAPVWQAMLTQLLFAVAFFCLSLVMSKRLNQSERSFGSTLTELEA